MPISLHHLSENTPMGANLIGDGATFRVWAPNAQAVHVIGDFNSNIFSENRSGSMDGDINDGNLLNRIENGHWIGFVPGVVDRHRYMFYIKGNGSEGLKRDPYARELQEPYPWKCVIRKTDFPWHETGYITPKFENFVIYQLHVGSFFTPNLPNKGGTFLDVVMKLPYLSALGITAIQLLPIQEFQTTFSKGYNGTDYFSPEMDFGISDDSLVPYLERVNCFLQSRALQPYEKEDLRGEMNQLKALVDLCHVYGIAVILDVVYNHAGGSWGSPNESIYFFDRQTGEDVNNNNSLYFTDKGHAGGLVFDYGKSEVRNFLIDNAKFFLDEYRVDGLRYDQVSVIDRDGAPHGWKFCQDLTSTLRYHKPSVLDKAEYWNVNPYIVKSVAEGGAGFDTSLTDGLRLAIRDVIGNASQPDERPLNMVGLAGSLWPAEFNEHWQFVQGAENHDIVYQGRDHRIARLGDSSNPRSWYGRSRARVASGISLTAPGIPMLFMGQEFLEDKQWSDNFDYHKDLLLYWEGLVKEDRQMLDHVRFTSDLINLRRQYPAFRGQGFSVIHTHDQNRVIAFHRWVEGEGHDVVVVVHLSNFNRFGYHIGFPSEGVWREVFNSDIYENYLNPDVAGNGGIVTSIRLPMHGYSYSANIVLPGNSILVFARS